MADYSIKDTTLQDIADAIRAKAGTSGNIKVKNFATEISNIVIGTTVVQCTQAEYDAMPTPRNPDTLFIIEEDES